MLDIIHLEEVIEEEETYLLHVRIPKSLYPFYQSIFENFQTVAENLSYKADIARQRGRDSKERRKRAEKERDLKTRTKMENLYNMVFKETKNHNEAMKAITHKFKQYWWVVKKFRKDIEAQRTHDISKLHEEGVNRRELAKRFGCCMATISSYSKKGRVENGKTDRGIYHLPQGKERLKKHTKQLHAGPKTVRKVACG